MTTISASEAKTHFGALMTKAQRGPVTIEKQGRPVAVVLSFEDYQAECERGPSPEEKKEALDFLSKGAKRSRTGKVKGVLEEDVRAEAIWEKYSRNS